MVTILTGNQQWCSTTIRGLIGINTRVLQQKFNNRMVTILTGNQQWCEESHVTTEYLALNRDALNGGALDHDESEHDALDQENRERWAIVQQDEECSALAVSFTKIDQAIPRNRANAIPLAWDESGTVL